jgi:hypothetical protein
MPTDPRYKDEKNLPPPPPDFDDPEADEPDDFEELFVANLNENALEQAEYDRATAREAREAEPVRPAQ